MISSGYASLNPPLKALVTGLRTAESITTSFGDFSKSFRAAVLILAIVVRWGISGVTENVPTLEKLYPQQT